MARPQENGNCESAHGHLKRRIKQHLLLRGSRDFASEEEYDLFLIGVLESANRLRADWGTITKRQGVSCPWSGAAAAEPVQERANARERVVGAGVVDDDDALDSVQRHQFARLGLVDLDPHHLARLVPVELHVGEIGVAAHHGGHLGVAPDLPPARRR